MPIDVVTPITTGKDACTPAVVPPPRSTQLAAAPGSHVLVSWSKAARPEEKFCWAGRVHDSGQRIDYAWQTTGPSSLPLLTAHSQRPRGRPWGRPLGQLEAVWPPHQSILVHQCAALTPTAFAAGLARSFRNLIEHNDDTGRLAIAKAEDAALTSLLARFRHISNKKSVAIQRRQKTRQTSGMSVPPLGSPSGVRPSGFPARSVLPVLPVLAKRTVPKNPVRPLGVCPTGRMSASRCDDRMALGAAIGSIVNRGSASKALALPVAAQPAVLQQTIATAIDGPPLAPRAAPAKRPRKAPPPAPARALPKKILARPATSTRVEDSAADLDELYDDDGVHHLAGPDDDEREDILEDLEDRVLELSAPQMGFRSGSSAPPPLAAAITGEDLLKLLNEAPPPELPALALKGMVSSTHAEHRRILRRLSEEMPADCLRRDLPTALVMYLQRKRQQKNWKFSSLLKQLASLQGALTNLPLYIHTSATIQLGGSPVWRQAIRAAGRAARTEFARQPKAITWQQVKEALAKESSLPIFAAVLLSWVTCARTGCILQLTTADVLVEGEILTITFRRGKGALSRRTQYTVHTMIPPEFLPRLNRWLQTRRDWLFPRELKSWQIKDCLRRVDPEFECRSLRRGAIQQLATTPNITDETILLFSGHSNVVTLRRYLNFGRKALHTRQQMAPAAHHLTN